MHNNFIILRLHKIHDHGNKNSCKGCNLWLLRKPFPPFLAYVLTDGYKEGNVNYHYNSYQCNRERSYSWLRKPLPARGSIAKAVIQNTHCVHRERAPPPKIMPHQHGSNLWGILFNRLPQDRQNWTYQIILDETLNLWKRNNHVTS